MGLLAPLAGCLPVDHPWRYPKVLRMDRTGSSPILPADLDQDGWDEWLFLRDSPPSPSNRGPTRALLFTDGDRGVWEQTNYAGDILTPRVLDVWHDERPEVVVPVLRGDSIFLSVASGEGQKLFGFLLATGEPRIEPDGALPWDPWVSGMWALDLDGDGRRELVTRAVHRLGNRGGGPFVVLNCAAIPEPMIEDELFGHVPHAFTDAKGSRRGCFQAADGGTLFLDEVGDMSLLTQAKVLRALEGGEIRPVGSDHGVPVDVRVITATHRDLRALIEDGDFREDLFYRLNVITIRVPSLAERPDDLAALAEHFLGYATREHGLAARAFSPAALATLQQHPWPGNVRELQNVIERLVVMSEGERIQARTVLEALRPGEEPAEGRSSLPGLREARHRFEREFITRTLEEHDWRIQEAAASLDINRSHLWKKMRSLEIESPDD